MSWNRCKRLQWGHTWLCVFECTCVCVWHLLCTHSPCKYFLSACSPPPRSSTWFPVNPLPTKDIFKKNNWKIQKKNVCITTVVTKSLRTHGIRHSQQETLERKVKQQNRKRKQNKSRVQCWAFAAAAVLCVCAVKKAELSNLMVSSPVGGGGVGGGGERGGLWR